MECTFTDRARPGSRMRMRGQDVRTLLKNCAGAGDDGSIQREGVKEQAEASGEISSSLRTGAAAC